LPIFAFAKIPEKPTGLEEIMKQSMVKDIPALSPSTMQIFGTFTLTSADTVKKFGAQFTYRAGAFVPFASLRPI
jgi:hypothetical protein